MSSNDRALVVGVLAVVALAVVGATVHLVPWLRDNRTEISLILLMLVLVASGFTAALALIATVTERPAPADGPDVDDADADSGMVCPECGEPARRRMPTDLVPAHYAQRTVPQWSHPDGTQLCPVVGSDGYEPADPMSMSTSLSETP